MAQSVALKEIFDANRFREFARQIEAIHRRFDTRRFLALSLHNLETLSLTQRLRRMTESLHATLPSHYPKALAVLRRVAPGIGHGFHTLVLPDYVGQYGLEHFDSSLDALKFFTPFGSSEFAVRPFLRRDLHRTLRLMEAWSRDSNEHVRRLASEGCRPRLPWSFHLETLIADPTPAAPILENLRTDPNLYVRKSVANHLNDITKDHPDWVLERLQNWSIEDPHTAWIAKRALRTLVKQGDRRALALIGAGAKARLRVHELRIAPRTIRLGESVTLSARIESTASKPQRLVIDYRVHYVKKAGGVSGKVFKLKELTLAPHEIITLSRKQSVRDFTTRTHHPGRHEVEMLINGESVARGYFDLQR